MNTLKNITKMCMLLVFVCTVHAGYSQKAKTRSKQTKEAKSELPPQEELAVDEIPPPPPPPMPPPTIDFDTTAAPQDPLTDSIRKLLAISGARGKDIEMAEKSLRQSLASMLENPETKETGEKFISRFVYEMSEGDAGRWLENVYIRNYRAFYTIEEIHDLIAFYQTPAGRKTLEKTLLLLDAVMTEARKIGAYLGPRVMAHVMNEGKNK
jgi:hypothetical protein